MVPLTLGLTRAVTPGPGVPPESLAGVAGGRSAAAAGGGYDDGRGGRGGHAPRGRRRGEAHGLVVVELKIKIEDMEFRG